MASLSSSSSLSADSSTQQCFQVPYRERDPPGFLLGGHLAPIGLHDPWFENTYMILYTCVCFLSLGTGTVLAYYQFSKLSAVQREKKRDEEEKQRERERELSTSFSGISTPLPLPHSSNSSHPLSRSASGISVTPGSQSDLMYNTSSSISRSSSASSLSSDIGPGYSPIRHLPVSQASSSSLSSTLSPSEPLVTASSSYLNTTPTHRQPPTTTTSPSPTPSPSSLTRSRSHKSGLHSLLHNELRVMTETNSLSSSYPTLGFLFFAWLLSLSSVAMFFAPLPISRFLALLGVLHNVVEWALVYTLVSQACSPSSKSYIKTAIGVWLAIEYCGALIFGSIASQWLVFGIMGCVVDVTLMASASYFLWTRRDNPASLSLFLSIFSHFLYVLCYFVNCSMGPPFPKVTGLLLNAVAMWNGVKFMKAYTDDAVSLSPLSFSLSSPSSSSSLVTSTSSPASLLSPTRTNESTQDTKEGEYYTPLSPEAMRVRRRLFWDDKITINETEAEEDDDEGESNGAGAGDRAEKAGGKNPELLVPHTSSSSSLFPHSLSLSPPHTPKGEYDSRSTSPPLLHKRTSSEGVVRVERENECSVALSPRTSLSLSHSQSVKEAQAMQLEDDELDAFIMDPFSSIPATAFSCNIS